MTVYIDDARIRARVGRINGVWSHLMADSTDELIEFALSLGLNPEWIQHEGSPIEHFDLTESKRKQAIRLGAEPIEYSTEGAALTQARFAGEMFDLLAFRESAEDD